MNTNFGRFFYVILGVVLTVGVLVAGAKYNVLSAASGTKVVNVCGLGTNINGISGNSPCEVANPVTCSSNGSNGTCSDPVITNFDTFIDVAACDRRGAAEGDQFKCDGSNGGSTIANINGGGSASTDTYIGGHCKVQLDVYKDDGHGRVQINFVVARNADNCTEIAPTNTPIPTQAPISCNPNNVNMSVTPNQSQLNNNVVFSLQGSTEGDTWIEDYWTPNGGGVNCSGTVWPSKTCQVTNGATASYTWTHKWKKCVGDVNHCSELCQKQAGYSVVAVPTLTPVPTVTLTPVPTVTTTPVINLTLASQVACTVPPTDPNTVNLSWQAVPTTGVTGYDVQRCSGAGCTNFTTFAAGGPTFTSYFDLVPEDETRSYRARVFTASQTFVSNSVTLTANCQGPTSVPTETPAATLTPTVTPTVTPTATPAPASKNSCGVTTYNCGSNENCLEPYYCFIPAGNRSDQGYCRLPACPYDNTCTCQVLGYVAPTPTPGPVAPVAPRTGFDDSLWAGLIMAAVSGAGYKVFTLAKRFW